VQWFLPWKRCLAMLEQGRPMARWTFSTATTATHCCYPSEPLSEVEFVMFYANGAPTPPEPSTTCAA
jgi:polar amino acid transport system substrate-binding protein